jgi:hypothetical protein
MHKLFNNHDLQEIRAICYYAIKLTQIHRYSLYCVSDQIIDLCFCLWAKQMYLEFALTNLSIRPYVTS